MKVSWRADLDAVSKAADLETETVSKAGSPVKETFTVSFTGEPALGLSAVVAQILGWIYAQVHHHCHRH